MITKIELTHEELQEIGRKVLADLKAGDTPKTGRGKVIAYLEDILPKLQAKLDDMSSYATPEVPYRDFVYLRHQIKTMSALLEQTRDELAEALEACPNARIDPEKKYATRVVFTHKGKEYLVAEEDGLRVKTVVPQQAKPKPAGTKISGIVTSFKDGDRGRSMYIRNEQDSVFLGDVPAGLREAAVGDMVELYALVKPSRSEGLSFFSSVSRSEIVVKRTEAEQAAYVAAESERQ